MELAKQIKNLPLEMISQIFKDIKIRYYVSIIFSIGFVVNIEWFDSIEDALSYYFFHCKRVYYNRRDSGQFKFEFGSNKMLHGIDNNFWRYLRYDINEIENILQILKEECKFDSEKVLKRLDLENKFHYEDNIIYLELFEY